MSKRAIAIVPELPVEPIGALRRRFDPLAGKLPPHLTLVFPFESDLSPDDLRGHVERAVEGVAPFPLRLAGVVGSEGEYLFLTVKRGNDALIALHDRLYLGTLQPHLSLERPYLPHLTLGRLPDPSALRAALAVVPADLTFETGVRSVTVYCLAPSGERSLETDVPLPEPSGKGGRTTVAHYSHAGDAALAAAPNQN